MAGWPRMSVTLSPGASLAGLADGPVMRSLPSESSDEAVQRRDDRKRICPLFGGLARLLAGRVAAFEAAFEDEFGDGPHRGAVVHGGALNPAERLGFGQSVFRHECA